MASQLCLFARSLHFYLPHFFLRILCSTHLDNGTGWCTSLHEGPRLRPYVPMFLSDDLVAQCLALCLDPSTRCACVSLRLVCKRLASLPLLVPLLRASCRLSGMVSPVHDRSHLNVACCPQVNMLGTSPTLTLIRGSYRSATLRGCDYCYRP